MMIILVLTPDKMPTNDLLFWGVKSWLNFFSPTTAPRVIWSEDSWISDSIFWHDFETNCLIKKTFGRDPAILTSLVGQSIFGFPWEF